MLGEAEPDPLGARLRAALALGTSFGDAPRLPHAQRHASPSVLTASAVRITLQPPRSDGGGGGISKVLRLSSSSSEKISLVMSSAASSSFAAPSSRLVSAKRSASTPKNCHSSLTAS